jgi:hypothetical protein
VRGSTAACLAALIIAAACDREPCPQPTPKPLTSQSLGEPCGGDGNCAGGFTCRTVYALAEYDSNVFTANACTAICDAGCPSSGTCGPFGLCWKACGADADCRSGISAGFCDGGLCERLRCTEDAACPAGYSCEIPAVVCCPSGAQCRFSGNVPGYCRKAG